MERGRADWVGMMVVMEDERSMNMIPSIRTGDWRRA